MSEEELKEWKEEIKQERIEAQDEIYQFVDGASLLFLIDKILELKEKCEEHIYIEANKQIQQLYISKDKIKEKIKELERLNKEQEIPVLKEYKSIRKETIDYFKELIGEEYAVQSYNAINGTNFEPQDITKWDKDIEVDFIMHGSPCQDFSIAGKNAGGDERKRNKIKLNV